MPPPFRDNYTETLTRGRAFLNHVCSDADVTRRAQSPRLCRWINPQVCSQTSAPSPGLNRLPLEALKAMLSKRDVFLQQTAGGDRSEREEKNLGQERRLNK